MSKTGDAVVGAMNAQREQEATEYPEKARKAQEEAATWNEQHWKELRKLWTDLHIFAARFNMDPEEEDVADAEEWLKQWYAKFPPDCPCVEEWTRILAVCPPPISDGAMAFFWWTVAAHDRVNLYLGRRLWTNRSKTHPLLRELLNSDSAQRTNYTRLMAAPAINKV